MHMKWRYNNHLLLLCFVLVFVIVSGFQCEKESTGGCKDALRITAVQVEAAPTVATGIGIQVDIEEGNLCYRFENFSTTMQPGNIIAISAMGIVPCENAVCPQAIYSVSPTGRITVPAAGNYTLRFFNRSAIFQSVNVTVN